MALELAFKVPVAIGENGCGDDIDGDSSADVPGRIPLDVNMDE